LILLNVFLFLLGLFLLYLGAELLVRGSARLALMLRISPIIVGLTIVAFGTSSPEFLVSFVAAIKGNIGVSVGNIVGSNIANIGLVLGLSALLRPISHFNQDIKGELIWMTAVAIVFWLFSLNNVIGFWEGFLLFAGIIVFTLLLVRESMKERKNNTNPDVPNIETGYKFIDRLSKNTKTILFTFTAIIGIIVLAFGSRLTIDSAVLIAEVLGVSQVVIGLTMVAFGTSLPELATGIISVIKKENEILVGNVIGSNLFNILGVAGPIALFYPIPLTNRLVWFDFPVMLVFTILLFALMLWGNRISRLPALIFFLAYLFYITFVVIM